MSKEDFLGEKAERDVSDKAETAFNVLDRNHDGYITKGDMMKMSKNITKKQVNL